MIPVLQEPSSKLTSNQQPPRVQVHLDSRPRALILGKLSTPEFGNGVHPERTFLPAAKPRWSMDGKFRSQKAEEGSADNHSYIMSRP